VLQRLTVPQLLLLLLLVVVVLLLLVLLLISRLLEAKAVRVKRRRADACGSTAHTI
jgi:NADH:ubiquinone oxidoreductase subunit 3 (subunit A)